MSTAHASRISRIPTNWTTLNVAHRASAGEHQYAQQSLLEQYASAVHRYLLAAVGNENDADDLMQEFGLRFLEGRLQNANPEKGRFRDFLKKSLVNLVVDHQRRRRRCLRPMLYDPQAAGNEELCPEAKSREFDEQWREEVLNQSWQALRAECDRNNQLYYTALRLRAQYPAHSSAELALELSRRLGKPITVTAFRKTLSRARRRMAELLVDYVRSSLPNPTQELLEEELIELNLWQYCRPVLQHIQDRTSGDLIGEN